MIPASAPDPPGTPTDGTPEPSPGLHAPPPRGRQTQTFTISAGSLSLPVHSPIEVVTSLTSYSG